MASRRPFSFGASLSMSMIESCILDHFYVMTRISKSSAMPI